MQALLAHPEVDVLFGHAVLFGAINADHPGPPQVGVLDSRTLMDALFRLCWCARRRSCMRRSLFDRLGPFRENFDGDDYDYWFRCLRAGAKFYFDPRRLLN